MLLVHLLLELGKHLLLQLLSKHKLISADRDTCKKWSDVMYAKKILFVLSTLLLLAFSGCSNTNGTESKISKNNRLNDNYNINSVDKFLSSQKFDISYNSNKTIVYIFFPSKRLVQYNITNKGIINITAKANQMFVLSLHENRLILAQWNIQNNIDTSMLNPLGSTKIEVNTQNTKKLIGMDYSRKNFYFMPLKKGKQSIIFKYLNKNSSCKEYFQITINVTIN